MTPQRRDLMLRVVDGHQSVLPLVYHADRLTRCDEVLVWLIKNNITGFRFISFFQEKDFSILQTFSDVLRRINKEKQCSPIIAGKDYIV